MTPAQADQILDNHPPRAVVDQESPGQIGLTTVITWRSNSVICRLCTA